MTPLHWAAAEGRREEVRFYLSQGVNPNLVDNWVGSTPLHWAAQAGESGPIRALLEHGANPNARSGGGYTPLMESLSQQRGLLLAAFALIDGGANVNAANIDGYTALHNAAANDTNENIYRMIRMLRIMGANPNATAGRYDATPLHEAVVNGNEDAIWSLTSEITDAPPASVDLPDNRGLTPLHWASGAVIGSGDLVAVVRVLVERGANINAEDPDGYTPLDYAVRSAQEQVAEELRSIGARRGRF